MKQFYFFQIDRLIQICLKLKENVFQAVLFSCAIRSRSPLAFGSLNFPFIYKTLCDEILRSDVWQTLNSAVRVFNAACKINNFPKHTKSPYFTPQIQLFSFSLSYQSFAYQ